MKMPSRGCRLLFVLLFPAFLTGFYHFPRFMSLHQRYFPSQNNSVCGCDTCIRDGEPWLSNLLAKSPHPFVSNRSNISASTFNYWRAFQFDRRSFAYYQNTVDKVLRMFPHIPQVAQPSPDRCVTCAVVGNSGNLNGSHYGPLIDFHDLVIRINRGPTKGFEQDVGNRTTHHVMYPVSATNLDNNTHLVLFPFKIGDFEWLMRTFTPRKGKAQSPAANKDLVMILNPAFMEYVHKEWLTKKGRYPSTGFMTVVLSLLMCDEVSVFGFGADRYGNWNHYYEVLKVKNLKTGQHPGGQEYTMLNKLFFNRKIRFFRAW